MRIHHLAAGVAVLCASLAASTDARAARSYENCTGTISSLPAVIGTQGTWCMNKDLATSLSSGAAITITTNNVILDCNDFKLGGLLAGTGTTAYGILATDRQNVTVRNCNVRGFHTGLRFDGIASSGHLVEDNRFDLNTLNGIQIRGDNTMVRRNLVLDTGGSTFSMAAAYGIHATDDVDIIGNTVSGVAPVGTGDQATAFGILAGTNGGGRIQDNVVRGLVTPAYGSTFGILHGGGGYAGITGNHVAGSGPLPGTGIACADAASVVRGNVVMGFPTPVGGTCTDAGGNDASYIAP